MMQWFSVMGPTLLIKKYVCVWFVCAPGDLFMFSACVSNLFLLSIFHSPVWKFWGFGSV